MEEECKDSNFSFVGKRSKGCIKPIKKVVSFEAVAQGLDFFSCSLPTTAGGQSSPFVQNLPEAQPSLVVPVPSLGPLSALGRQTFPS